MQRGALSVPGLEIPPFGSWRYYTPTLSAAGASPTQPTLGTAPLQLGKWFQIGTTVIVKFKIGFSASLTAGNGTVYRISLPVPSTRDHASFADDSIGFGEIARAFSSQALPVSFFLGDELDNQHVYISAGDQTLTGSTGALATGATSWAVNHNGPGAPTIVNIQPTADPRLFGGAVLWWTDNYTSTQFTVHAMTAAGGNTAAAITWNYDAHFSQNLVGANFPYGGWSSGDRIYGTAIYETTAT